MCSTIKVGETAEASGGERQPARLPAHAGKSQACAAQPAGRRRRTRLIFAHTAEHSRTEARQSRVTRMHRPLRLTPKTCTPDGRQYWQSWKVDRVNNVRVRSQMISTLCCWHTRTGTAGGKPRRMAMCLTGAANLIARPRENVGSRCVVSRVGVYGRRGVCAH